MEEFLIIAGIIVGLVLMWGALHVLKWVAYGAMIVFKFVHDEWGIVGVAVYGTAWVFLFPLMAVFCGFLGIGCSIGLAVDTPIGKKTYSAASNKSSKYQRYPPSHWAEILSRNRLPTPHDLDSPYEWRRVIDEAKKLCENDHGQLMRVFRIEAELEEAGMLATENTHSGD